MTRARAMQYMYTYLLELTTNWERGEVIKTDFVLRLLFLSSIRVRISCVKQVINLSIFVTKRSLYSVSLLKYMLSSVHWMSVCVYIGVYVCMDVCMKGFLYVYLSVLQSNFCLY